MVRVHSGIKFYQEHYHSLVAAAPFAYLDAFHEQLKLKEPQSNTKDANKIYNK